MKEKLIIFHPAIAPYRIDFFNFLHDNYDLFVYFESEFVNSQKFDVNYLNRISKFKSKILNFGFNVKSTSFRFGIFNKLICHKPDLIITSEFGFITFLVSFYKIFFFNSFKHYIICDDNIQISKDRKGFRSFFRTIFSKYSNGVLYTSFEIGEWNKVNISKKINPLINPIIHDETVFRKKIIDSLDVAKNNITKFNLINKKILLFVGRLIPIKNIPLIIDAMLKVDNTILIIVGKGILQKELSEKVKTLGLSNRVYFVGFLSGNELYAWYAISHILILPSNFEPFGTVVNEALLGGCYVLCSNKVGASSLINNNNGSIFNPDAPNDYLQMLNSLLLKCNQIISPEMVSERINRMPIKFIDQLIKLKQQL